MITGLGSVAQWYQGQYFCDSLSLSFVVKKGESAATQNIHN